MSCSVADLTHGAVCLALYPYTTGFPLDRVVRDAAADELETQIETAESIEALEATLGKGAVPELVVKAKLRRVVLLQTGTSASRHDITVARVNSITEAKRGQKNWYLKLKSGIHVAHLMIGAEDRHGTAGVEAYVDCLSISTIQKSTILRRVGQLDDEEMRAVTERLVRTLELDLSGYLGRLRAPAEGEPGPTAGED
jgi:hypothetical protein